MDYSESGQDTNRESPLGASNEETSLGVSGGAGTGGGKQPKKGLYLTLGAVALAVLAAGGYAVLHNRGDQAPVRQGSAVEGKRKAGGKNAQTRQAKQAVTKKLAGEPAADVLVGSVEKVDVKAVTVKSDATGSIFRLRLTKKTKITPPGELKAGEKIKVTHHLQGKKLIADEVTRQG